MLVHDTAANAERALPVLREVRDGSELPSSDGGNSGE